MDMDKQQEFGHAARIWTMDMHGCRNANKKLSSASLVFYYSSLQLGCFRKCQFGIPRNTEFYTELVLFRVIPRNSAKFVIVQFRGIPCRFVYTEFHIPSNENTVIEPITKDLLKLLMYFVVKGTVAQDLPPPFFFIKSTHLGA